MTSPGAGNAANVASNLERVRGRIARACERAGRSPQEVTLVAITKETGVSAVKAAFAAGVRTFGENRVQEAQDKLAYVADIRGRTVWHMVGRLQMNKAGRAAQLFDIIESVDSVRLAESLSRHAACVLPILLQVNVAGEGAKTGFAPGEVREALRAIGRLPNLRVDGLMTIAPAVEDPETVRPVFQELRHLRDSLGLKHISMGMTDDFEVAIEEGATMVRIGRAIFGGRSPAR